MDLVGVARSALRRCLLVGVTGGAALTLVACPGASTAQNSSPDALAADYTCVQAGGPNGFGAQLNGGVIHVRPGGVYQWNDTAASTFTYDADTGLLHFQGTLSDALQAQYASSHNQPRIVLYFTGSSQPILVGCASNNPNGPPDPPHPAPAPTIAPPQNNGSFQPVTLQGVVTNDTSPGDRSASFDLPAGSYTLSWVIGSDSNACSASIAVSDAGGLPQMNTEQQTGSGSKPFVIRQDIQAHLDILGVDCPWSATISAAGP